MLITIVIHIIFDIPYFNLSGTGIFLTPSLVNQEKQNYSEEKELFHYEYYLSDKIMVNLINPFKITLQAIVYMDELRQSSGLWTRKVNKIKRLLIFWTLAGNNIAETIFIFQIE